MSKFCFSGKIILINNQPCIVSHEARKHAAMVAILGTKYSITMLRSFAVVF